ncbi:DUF3800 domain-containing protein [Sporosarcina sp. P20a]|uniref:DUF3800 domain-containing protein n=1 Tax=Sporosarcina sp. P20a TaxID=2048256 RepID=UPI00130472F8|nr:DUF3800 domain-containing protein [Sporosarcina sp. P20a]
MSESNKDVIEEVGPDEKSEEEIEKERFKNEEKKSKADELWKAIQAGDDKKLTTRVASILNRYPNTRNSDLTLQMQYWRVYNGITSETVNLKDLYKLERLTSITRARAKIQNEYQLFRADDEVRRRRRTREEEEKESQLLDKPSYKSIDVFSDETGKTADYVFVAGVWFLESQVASKVQRDFVKWSIEKEKAGVNLPKEFHFMKLQNNSSDHLELYKEFFDLIMQNSAMISFKAVGVNKTKINRMSISDLVIKLYYQFVRLGVDHEISSERISLPHKINLTKDYDGESELVIENIKQEIGDNFKIHHGDDLVMDQLICMDSQKNIFLQFADLFAASINRKYNNPGNNNKDKLAEYILDAVGINEINISAREVERTDVEMEDNSDHSVLFMFD